MKSGANILESALTDSRMLLTQSMLTEDLIYVKAKQIIGDRSSRKIWIHLFTDNVLPLRTEVALSVVWLPLKRPPDGYIGLWRWICHIIDWCEYLTTVVQIVIWLSTIYQLSFSWKCKDNSLVCSHVYGPIPLKCDAVEFRRWKMEIKSKTFKSYAVILIQYDNVIRIR